MALSIPKLLRTLISFIALSLMLANKVHSQDDTISFEIDNFYSQSSDLTYQGDAHVLSGSNILRLTGTDASDNPLQGSVGRVLYSNPIPFWETGRQASFETTITFEITPTDDNPADGIAFFIAPVNFTFPCDPSGGRLGIFDSLGTTSPIFAVEFDTYVNSGWDPRFPHIGINFQSRNSSVALMFENITRQVVTARINYVSETRVISVHATSGSQTFPVSDIFDLKTILPQQVQVGISAATGLHVALHDIRSWHFTSTMVRDDHLNNNEDTYIRQYM